jgi:hypothetical protein
MRALYDRPSSGADGHYGEHTRREPLTQASIRHYVSVVNEGAFSHQHSAYKPCNRPFQRSLLYRIDAANRVDLYERSSRHPPASLYPYDLLARPCGRW